MELAQKWDELQAAHMETAKWTVIAAFFIAFTIVEFIIIVFLLIS